MNLQRAAGTALRCAERTWERSAEEQRFPSVIDYLSWADAYTVHRPDWPERRHIARLRAEALSRSQNPRSAADSSSADPLNAALRIITCDAQHGYPSARHVMQFPANAGFYPASALQCGDVFSRAVVLGALLSARSCGAAVPDHLVSEGVEYLMRSRRRGGAGGWAYFPGLIELAPDADTLAQVAQVFVLAGRPDLLRRYVVPQLDRVAAAERPDGSLETWLYDDGAESGAIQRTWAAQAWGTGVDPEVVANVVCAARQVDSNRYAALIDGAQRFLARLGSDGMWEATWYHGPFYGTFIATRALAGSPHASGVFPRTLAWLRRMQRDDGGWGSSEYSDPLSTALAVSTLALLSCDAVPVDRGLQSLRTAAAEGALANEVPLIRMNFGRARGEPGPIASFGSASLTAAFVITAVVNIQSSCAVTEAVAE